MRNYLSIRAAWKREGVFALRYPRLGALLLLMPTLLPAQGRGDLDRIMERLDRLEQQNRELLAEIKSLRQELTAREQPAATSQPAPPLDERVSTNEQRINDLAQTRLEAEHRLPVQLSGMLLFNAFLNGRASADQQYPVTASPTSGTASGGATVRQTIIGLKFQGPEVLGGAKVSGSAFMDFFAGTGTSLNQLFRLRTANIDFAWKNTTFTVSQDKPLIAQRDPDSLAQVGVSPLTGSGNLWLWQPQARLEQRFAFGQSGVRAQFSLYQTSERANGIPTEYAGTVPGGRPGFEGRFELWHRLGDERAFEIAPGFHVSDTHVAGASVPSRIFTIDWRIPLAPRTELTGAFFNGENLGVLGGLRQGVSFLYAGQSPRAVHGTGGWAQLQYRATSRLTFNLYGGQEDDENRGLAAAGIAKNQSYAANLMYRLGSNVLASFEASQVRTTYIGSGTQLNPHYDLALAYLF
jgi:hypothetical protein